MGQMGLNYCWERAMTGEHKGKSKRGHFLNTQRPQRRLCPTQRMEQGGGKSLSTASHTPSTPATETSASQPTAAIAVGKSQTDC